MKAALLLVVFALLAVVVATFTTPLQHHKPAIEKAFKSADSFLKLHNKAVQKNGLGELTVPCALCGIVVNEIEGFVAENISESDIINFIQKDVCSLLSIFSDACDEVVKLVPEIIDLIEKKNTPSSVCINLKFCDAPFYHQADPSDVPTHIINLDLPANERFVQVCSVPNYIAAGKFLTGVLRELLGADVYTAVEEIGWFLNAQYFPTERSQEIDGCAKAMGISTGWLALLNIGYEVSDACTSIVAQNPSGIMLHARNMDFWAGMGFTDTLKNITYTAVFQKRNRTVFQATQFAGYVGILSGMRNNAFSVTINTRFYPQGPVDMFEEIIVAITERNASLVSFLSRAVLENEPNYASAVSALSNGTLIADVYYTIAGVSAGQGVVLSRNRTGAANVWNLAKQGSGVWYLVQTNYDHWEQPPWFDNRVTPAVNGMNALGSKRVTLTGLLSVLSIKPVLNIQTTFSTMMTPADSYFKSYTRWCPYPCVE